MALGEGRKDGSFYYSVRYSEDSLMWQVYKEYDNSSTAIFIDGFYSKGEADEHKKSLASA